MRAPFALLANPLPLVEKSIDSARALWLVIAAVIALDATWAWWLGIRIALSPAIVFDFVLLTIVSIVYSTLRPNRMVASFFQSMAELIVFMPAAGVLSYLAAASSPFALADQHLAAADAAIGFDWMPLFDWMRSQPSIKYGLTLSYFTAGFQIIALLIVVNGIRRFERSEEFVWLFVLTSLICIFVSWAVPAAGAWSHYGVSHLTSAYYLPDFHAIRSGQKPELALDHLTGIVQFPSFHAAGGLILILVCRGIKILFPLAIGLNVPMIFSALTEGGHHLVDVLAGLAVVPIAFVMFRSIKRITQ